MVESYIHFTSLKAFAQENQQDNPEKKNAARVKKTVDPDKVADKAAKVGNLCRSLFFLSLQYLTVPVGEGTTREESGESGEGEEGSGSPG